MNYELNKDGVIYKAMNKHRQKNIRYCLTVLAILIIYFFSCKPYITNTLFGATPLNEAEFKKDAVTRALKVQKNADGEVSQLINSKVLKDDSYWQGDKYEFTVELTDVRQTEITYTTKNTSENPEDAKGEKSAVVYLAKIGGIDTIVLAYPEQKIENGTKIDGIFAPIPPVVSYDMLLNNDFADKEFYLYMLDTRGLEMENEGFDIVACIVLLAVLLFLTIKVVIQYVKPLSTPTYRCLSKFGDVKTISDDVEDQLKKKGISLIKRKQSVITEDWILTEEPFKLKVAKNHTKPQDSSRYGSRL